MSDQFTWQTYLQRWNDFAFSSDDEIIAQGLTSALRERGWLGFDGASEAQIAAAEKRLGVALPPSYKTFLRTSNGFWMVGATNEVERLLSAEEIHWMRDGDRADMAIWGQNYPDIPQCLQISSMPNESVIYLNPLAVDPQTGEWECVEVITYAAEFVQWESFGDFMVAEYTNLTEVFPAGWPKPRLAREFRNVVASATRLLARFDTYARTDHQCFLTGHAQFAVDVSAEQAYEGEWTRLFPTEEEFIVYRRLYQALWSFYEAHPVVDPPDPAVVTHPDWPQLRALLHDAMGVFDRDQPYRPHEPGWEYERPAIYPHTAPLDGRIEARDDSRALLQSAASGDMSAIEQLLGGASSVDLLNYDPFALRNQVIAALHVLRLLDQMGPRADYQFLLAHSLLHQGVERDATYSGAWREEFENEEEFLAYRDLFHALWDFYEAHPVDEPTDADVVEHPDWPRLHEMIVAAHRVFNPYAG